MAERGELARLRGALEQANVPAIAAMYPNAGWDVVVRALVDAARALEQPGGLGEVLEGERAYAAAMRDTLIRLGHHVIAKHQAPQQYDSMSGDACTIPACLATLTVQHTEEEEPRMNDTEALELAWGVIANAGGGDWSKETPEWQEAAARWRDAVMPGLSARLSVQHTKEEA